MITQDSGRCPSSGDMANRAAEVRSDWSDQVHWGKVSPVPYFVGARPPGGDVPPDKHHNGAVYLGGPRPGSGGLERHGRPVPTTHRLRVSAWNRLLSLVKKCLKRYSVTPLEIVGLRGIFNTRAISSVG